MTYDVWTLNETNSARLYQTNLSAEDAGYLIGCDGEDVEAWVELEGRCDGAFDAFEATIVEHGQPYPGKFDEDAENEAIRVARS